MSAEALQALLAILAKVVSSGLGGTLINEIVTIIIDVLPSVVAQGENFVQAVRNLITEARGSATLEEQFAALDELDEKLEADWQAAVAKWNEAEAGEQHQ